MYGQLVVNELFILLTEDTVRTLWQGPWHAKPFMEVSAVCKLLL